MLASSTCRFVLNNVAMVNGFEAVRSGWPALHNGLKKAFAGGQIVCPTLGKLVLVQLAFFGVTEARHSIPCQKHVLISHCADDKCSSIKWLQDVAWHNGAGRGVKPSVTC